MTTKIVSSDQARAKWRELLDTAVSGEYVIIERYGKPVAVLIPYQDYLEPGVLHEETAVYLTNNWDAIKAKLAAEIKAELLAQTIGADIWFEQLQQLKERVAQTGGIMVGKTKDEIVEALRQTRQKLFEAEYAHLCGLFCL